MDELHRGPAGGAALPAGSYLAIQHPTRDFYARGLGADRSYRNAGIPFQYRTAGEFGRFVAGLDLVRNDESSP